MKDFLDNYSSLGLPVQKRLLEGFLGYFTSEFGLQDQVVHLWAFTDLEDRRRRRQLLAEDADWQACIAILYPTAFSPIGSLPVASDDPLTAFNFSPATASAE